MLALRKISLCIVLAVVAVPAPAQELALGEAVLAGVGCVAGAISM